MLGFTVIAVFGHQDIEPDRVTMLAGCESPYYLAIGQSCVLKSQD
ncbi:hypothetical protein yrohd0001_28760 [Yersinia rohdei ATCC 43380]|nr:hypothetical protein yrohd0001_28760 [Yersinia rohdei ATCC 43380]